MPRGRNNEPRSTARDSNNGTTRTGVVTGHDGDGQHSTMRVRSNGSETVRFVDTDTIREQGD